MMKEKQPKQTMKARFTAAQKANAAFSLMKGEKTSVEIAKELGCHPTLIGEWRDRLLTAAHGIFESPQSRDDQAKEVAQLEQMVGKLTVQLEFAKKVSGTFASR
jgi:transposase-like protein